MTTVAKPILFLATANDRDDRARYLRSLAKKARPALAATEQRGPLRAGSALTPALYRDFQY